MQLFAFIKYFQTISLLVRITFAKTHLRTRNVSQDETCCVKKDAIPFNFAKLGTVVMLQLSLRVASRHHRSSEYQC
jgi:hypothetical protein